MTYGVASYFWPFAPCRCWKERKAAGGVFTVPNGQDSGVVDNDRYLTLKKTVRFRGWTEIVEGDCRTASSLVECVPWEDENCLYRPSASKTAGACYQEWLRLYLCDEDCLLCKKGGQFCSGVCVERRWTTPVGEVTV